MKKKSIIATSICGALLAANVITGLQFKKEMNTKDQEINRLHSMNDQYVETINTYRLEEYDYKVNISELNNKISDLQQKLKEVETKDRNRNSP